MYKYKYVIDTLRLINHVIKNHITENYTEITRNPNFKNGRKVCYGCITFSQVNSGNVFTTIIY